MQSPSVDIIVPVWNSPFETRVCLAAIQKFSPEARLVVVDNGSSRETELMLEDFSEPLGADAIFIKSEKNIGLVKAVNLGLNSSDSDYAVIVRPHVQVTDKWLDELVDAGRLGIAVPALLPVGIKSSSRIKGVSRLETFSVSFSVIVLKREMRQAIGSFDESLDGGAWCLADYVRRGAEAGYRTQLCTTSKVLCANEPKFGSEARLAEMANNGQRIYTERWGKLQSFVVYFGSSVDQELLQRSMETILKAARLGHRFILLLQSRENKLFLRSGWNCLHTAIEIRTVSALFSARDVKKQITWLREQNPELIVVEGTYGALRQQFEDVYMFERIGSLPGLEAS